MSFPLLGQAKFQPDFRTCPQDPVLVHSSTAFMALPCGIHHTTSRARIKYPEGFIFMPAAVDVPT